MLVVTREGLKLYARIAAALDRLAPIPVHERAPLPEDEASSPPTQPERLGGQAEALRRMLVDGLRRFDTFADLAAHLEQER